MCVLLQLVFHGVEPFQRMHGAHPHHPQALIATPTLVSAALVFLQKIVAPD